LQQAGVRASEKEQSSPITPIKRNRNFDKSVKSQDRPYQGHLNNKEGEGQRSNSVVPKLKFT
jgi:hypothetical protein